MYNFEKYKYNLLILKFKFNDNDYYKYVQKYLSNYEIYWASYYSIHIYDMDYYNEQYLYIILNEKKDFYRKKFFMLKSSKLDHNFIKNYDFDPYIYESKDFYKIRSIIQYGGFIPSYKPKKITRCL